MTKLGRFLRMRPSNCWGVKKFLPAELNLLKEGVS